MGTFLGLVIIPRDYLMKLVKKMKSAMYEAVFKAKGGYFEQYETSGWFTLQLTA